MRFDWSFQLFAWKMTNVQLLFIALWYIVTTPFPSCRYHEMPKVVRAPAHISDPSKQARGTIAQYFATQHCPACQQLTVDGICSKCRADPQKMAVTLTMRKRRAEKTDADINTVS